MNNTSKSPSLLYEWEWDPGECMMLWQAGWVFFLLLLVRAVRVSGA
jgi:hypothetical protein